MYSTLGLLMLFFII
jgi:hypothetical protein